MSDSKIVSLQKYKESKRFKQIWQVFLRSRRMIFLVIILAICLGSVLWSFLIENPARLDVQIPKSNNITFNNSKAVAMTTAQLASEFENNEGKPILLYIYTTWCSSCVKQTPVINEIAREFQNTELKVIAIAIDKDLDSSRLQSHLNHFGDLYFEPRYLVFKDGFVEFLRKKKINYQGKIPYTIFISQYGDIVTKYVGAKSHNYLRNKIIKEIYQ
ncbi:MAG: TlpA family protein disulfide reductase [Rickettsiales bacterium]|nr:TlpA family protein disulfide reductase [Rickettsiales bacterium]